MRTAESMLEPADLEIYIGELFGRPFYLPRMLACCAGRRRDFPHDRMQALCHAMRRVARIQVGMVSLFNHGLPENEADGLQRQLPAGQLPHLIGSLDCVWEVRLP